MSSPKMYTKMALSRAGVLVFITVCNSVYMFLFQTHMYDVHVHTDVTSQRRTCVVTVESVWKPPHRAANAVHVNCLCLSRRRLS